MAGIDWILDLWLKVMVGDNGKRDFWFIYCCKNAILECLLYSYLK